MLLQYVVLFRWNEDPDPAAMATFEQEVPEIMAKAPFESVKFGPSLGLAPAMSADWGFVAVISEDDFETWRTDPLHRRLREIVEPIRAEGRNIQFAL